MPKYIKKKDLKNAIDECTWYHIGKGGELVEGANSYEHEPLYKYSDIKEIIKNLPTRKFETEPKRTALSKALMEQVDEPKTQTETQNSNLTFEKDECAKEYEELGLKELKELIEADRKTEPTISKMEQVEDEPQTDCPWK